MHRRWKFGSTSRIARPSFENCNRVKTLTSLMHTKPRKDIQFRFLLVAEFHAQMCTITYYTCMCDLSALGVVWYPARKRPTHGWEYVPSQCCTKRHLDHLVTLQCRCHVIQREWSQLTGSAYPPMPRSHFLHPRRSRGRVRKARLLKLAKAITIYNLSSYTRLKQWKDYPANSGW